MTEITALLSSVAPGAIRAPAGIAAAPDFSLLFAGAMLPVAAFPDKRQPLADSGKPLPVLSEPRPLATPTAARLIADSEALDVVPPALFEDSAPPAPNSRPDLASQPQTPHVDPNTIGTARMPGPVARDIAQPRESDTIATLEQDVPDSSDDSSAPATPHPAATGNNPTAPFPVPASPTATPPIASIEPASIEPARTPARAGVQVRDLAIGSTSSADEAPAPAPAEAQATPSKVPPRENAVVANTTPVAHASTPQAAPSGPSQEARPQVVTPRAAYAAPLPKPLTQAESPAVDIPKPVSRTPAKAGVQACDLAPADTSLSSWTPASIEGPAISGVRADAPPLLANNDQQSAGAALRTATSILPTRPERPALRGYAASPSRPPVQAQRRPTALPTAAAPAIEPAADLPRTPAKAGVQVPTLPIDNPGLPGWTPASARLAPVSGGAADAAPAVVANAVPLARTPVPEAIATSGPARQTAPGKSDHLPAMPTPIPTVAMPLAADQPEPAVLARADPTAPAQPAAASPVSPREPSPLPTATKMAPSAPDQAAQPTAVTPLVASDPAPASRPVAILPVEATLAAIPPQPAAQAAPTTPASVAPTAVAAHAPMPSPPSILPPAPPVMTSVVPASPMRPDPALPTVVAAPERTPAPAHHDAAAASFATLPAPAAVQPQRIEPVAIPASQAFASAVFAAIETARSKPAPRGHVAELAMIAGIDLSSPTPVAATVQAAATTLDTGRGEWLDGMIDQIEMLTAATGTDRRETRIRLNPDQLGSVDIAIERDGDTTNLRFTAETPAARTLLADAAPRLAELADARGLKLGHTHVDLGGSATQSNPQQHQRSPEREAEPNRTPPPVSAMADTDSAESLHRLA